MKRPKIEDYQGNIIESENRPDWSLFYADIEKYMDWQEQQVKDGQAREKELEDKINSFCPECQEMCECESDYLSTIGKLNKH